MPRLHVPILLRGAGPMDSARQDAQTAASAQPLQLRPLQARSSWLWGGAPYSRGGAGSTAAEPGGWTALLLFPGVQKVHITNIPCVLLLVKCIDTQAAPYMQG